MKAETPVMQKESRVYCQSNEDWLCIQWVCGNFSKVPKHISVEFSDKYVREAVPIWFMISEEYIYWRAVTTRRYPSKVSFFRDVYYVLNTFLCKNFNFKHETPKKLWVTLWEHEEAE